MDIGTIIVLMGGIGAAGGIIHGMVKKESYSLQMPFCSYCLELGFLGSASVGAASAISIFFVVSPLFNINIANLREANELLKIISIALIAGFAGQPLIASLSARLVNQISRIDQEIGRLKTRDDSDAFVKYGDFRLQNGDYKQAIVYYDKALEMHTQNIEALLGKGRALKNMGDMDGAIESCSKVLLIDKDNERALYNRACYKCLAGYSLAEILMDLRNVVDKYPYYKQYTSVDADFANVRNEPEFKALIGVANHADKQ